MNILRLCRCTVLAAMMSLSTGTATADDPLAQVDPFVRATASFARGDLAAAEALVVPLAAQADPPARVCVLLGDIRLRQTRTAEAVGLFRQALRLNPQSPTHWARLGQALLQYRNAVAETLRKELTVEAVAALQRSVELEPGFYDGSLALARYYSETPAEAGGDYDRAVHFAEIIRQHDSIEGTLLLANAAERHGRLETALERYREILQIYDGAPQLWANEARVLAKLGRNAEARATYERLIKRFPQWEPARQALAALPAATAEN